MTQSIYEQLKDDLGYLKLTRAAEVLPMLLDRARAEGLSHAQFLAELVAEEAAATRNRRLSARLRFAHFPVRRTLDEFDFDFQPSVDRKLVADATLRFVTQGTPVLLLGQPGCGKTHLAIARPPWRWRPATGATSPSAADLVATITSAYATAPSRPRSAPTPGQACW
jgi:DNA replication protein DnaC